MMHGNHVFWSYSNQERVMDVISVVIEEKTGKNNQGYKFHVEFVQKVETPYKGPLKLDSLEMPAIPAIQSSINPHQLV